MEAARGETGARGVYGDSPENGVVQVPLAGGHPVVGATAPESSFDGLQITHLVETEAHLRCEACRVTLTAELICPLCVAVHSAPCRVCRRRAYHLDGCPVQTEDREARRRFASPAAAAFSCAMGADPLPGGVGV